MITQQTQQFSPALRLPQLHHLQSALVMPIHLLPRDWLFLLIHLDLQTLWLVLNFVCVLNILCFIQTEVYWKEPRRYILTPKRKKLGKALARGCSKQVAGECLKDPKIRIYIIEKIGKIVRVEFCRLCSDKTDSILRKHSPKTFKEFTWDALTKELLVNAPVLMSILEGCTETKVERVNRKAVIGMCVVLLLKHRFMKMCLVQKIISLILYAGQASKQVISSILFMFITFQFYIQVFE